MLDTTKLVFIFKQPCLLADGIIVNQSVGTCRLHRKIHVTLSNTDSKRTQGYGKKSGVTTTSRSIKSWKKSFGMANEKRSLWSWIENNPTLSHEFICVQWNENGKIFAHYTALRHLGPQKLDPVHTRPTHARPILIDLKPKSKVKFSSLRFHRASTTVIHETHLKTTVLKAGNISTMLFVRDYSVGILKDLPKFNQLAGGFISQSYCR